jgi:P-type Ca2+ transporter type 2C
MTLLTRPISQLTPRSLSTQPTKEIVDFLETSPQGLSSDEAARRRRLAGANELPRPQRPSFIRRFLGQFKSPLIFILLVVAFLMPFVGDSSDAIIILFVLFFNAAVGLIQEGRASRALEALAQTFVETSLVLRGGNEQRVASAELVPGDIVLLREGDHVPADGRLIEAHGLRIDEATLTGESLSVSKTAEALAGAGFAIGDLRNCVFRQTHVVAGRGTMVVSTTGERTEVGKIALSLSSRETEPPLVKKINRLSRVIAISVGVFSLSLVSFGLFTGRPLLTLIATIASLIVSIIPEGLPIVLTLVLARGVSRMAENQAVVRRLNAVEGLGQVQVICTDKTGTLTTNRLNAMFAVTAGKIFAVEGKGYEPSGSIESGGERVTLNEESDLGRLALACGLLSQGSLKQVAGNWEAQGDPINAAMLTFALRAGASVEGWQMHEELPFSYTAKRRGGQFTKGEQTVSYMAGSPESILHLCRITKEDERFTQFAKQGLRIIALAARAGDSPLSAAQPTWDYLGFIALGDQLRPEVVESIAWCKDEDIRVVMITGDHPETALAIAKRAGIAQTAEEVLNGTEMLQLTDEQLNLRLEQVRVFSRISPDHKLRIVEAYQRQGLITAMTGDGVNDAPALHRADIGVSMGKSGTDVAREASDLILLDDNFATIVAAIQEGRAIIGNVRKVITYLFSTSVAEAIVLAFTLLANLPLPLLPAQILWLNLVTDGFLDVSLAMEPTHRTRHVRQASILDRKAGTRILLLGVTMSIGTLLVYTFSAHRPISEIRSLTLLTLAMFQWMNAWSARSETRSLLSLPPFGNAYLIGATLIVVILQLLAFYTPFLQVLLKTAPLSIGDWGIAASVSLSVLLVDELWKRLRRTPDADQPLFF